MPRRAKNWRTDPDHPIAHFGKLGRAGEGDPKADDRVIIRLGDGTKVKGTIRYTGQYDNGPWLMRVLLDRDVDKYINGLETKLTEGN